MRAFGLLLGTLVLLTPPPGAARGEEGGRRGPAGWTWTVALDERLARLTVELCFKSFEPRRLLLLDAHAAAFVAPAPPREPGGPRLAAGGEGAEASWHLEGAVPRGSPLCVSYAVDLAGLAAAAEARTRRVGDDLVTRPTEWLLRPALWLPEHDARLRLALPAGVFASTPWEPDADGGWRLEHDALAGVSRVAFTRRAPETLPRAGTPFLVSVLDGPHRASPAGVRRWLEVAIDAVAALWHGRFPAPRVQVLVEPVRPGGEPVVFGEATLAGGAAVHLLLSAAARDEDLPGEWIAVHELTHLGQPWIVPDDAWFTEGLVTYYQELLRGRAGIFGEQRTWQHLHDGFERGRRRGSARSVADDSAGMRAAHAYHRVYWAGAALALRIDLTLRRESAGRLSLDDCMRLWSGPRFRTRKGWRGVELLRAADEAFGVRLCTDCALGPLASAAFPATDDLYAALGLVASEGEVVLVPEDAARPGSAAAAALRRALSGGARPASPAAR